MADNYKNQIIFLLLVNIGTCILMFFNFTVQFPLWEILFFFSAIMIAYELYTLITYQTLFYFDKNIFNIIDYYIDYILPSIFVFITLSLFVYSNIQGIQIFLTLYYSSYIISFVFFDFYFLMKLKKKLFF